MNIKSRESGTSASTRAAGLALIKRFPETTFESMSQTLWSKQSKSTHALISSGRDAAISNSRPRSLNVFDVLFIPRISLVYQSTTKTADSVMQGRSASSKSGRPTVAISELTNNLRHGIYIWILRVNVLPRWFLIFSRGNFSLGFYKCIHFKIHHISNLICKSILWILTIFHWALLEYLKTLQNWCLILLLPRE